MEWEFTPEQVVGCEVDYDLEQFRADLLEEVRMNMGDMDDARKLKIFSAMYELCYWVATGNDYDEFLATLDQDSFFPNFLASIRDNLEPNIVMLGAILQRLIMDRVEGQSMPLEMAIKEVDELHRQVVAKPLLN
ncbi:MAG: hypothetical protein HZB47_12960 [Nitrosomonadales bacterium]|nr:hypothetical protein [Nitrosomonadales bacterium]